MSVAKSYPETVIEWGGTYWRPSGDELEPLVQVQYTLQDRQTYIKTGMQQERTYLQEAVRRSQRRTGGAAGQGSEMWMHDRLQKRAHELEEAAIRRFDDRHESLMQYLRTLGQVAGQLEFDLGIQ